LVATFCGKPDATFPHAALNSLALGACATQYPPQYDVSDPVRIMRLAFAVLGLALVAAGVQAQDVKVITTSGKWTAFVYQEDAKNVCYMESKPIKSEGAYKSRGEILLQVTNRPAEKAIDVVSVVAGYSYQPDSDATLQVGSRKFAFFTFGERAWARDTQTDKAVVAAMAKGASLTVRGNSSRGTPTVDTFSLQGFSAAHKAITDTCK
jgi:Invasion associated locus B (IalB) protein